MAVWHRWKDDNVGSPPSCAAHSQLLQQLSPNPPAFAAPAEAGVYERFISARVIVFFTDLMLFFLLLLGKRALLGPALLLHLSFQCLALQSITDIPVEAIRDKSHSDSKLLQLDASPRALDTCSSAARCLAMSVCCTLGS